MSTLSLRLGWPLYAGMLVAGAAAVVASASTLSMLAHLAGWQGWTPWLLPAAVDLGGSAGGWCWLRPGIPEPARRFGRVVALAGAAASLIGNAAGHLMTTDYLHPGPGLVVIVGAIPAAVLVALAHLAALLAVPPAQAPPADVTDEDTEPDQTEGDDEDEPVDEITDTRSAILTVIRKQPSTIAELAQATTRSRSTVIGHLTALTDAGSICRDETKRFHVLTRPHLISDSAEESLP